MLFQNIYLRKKEFTSNASRAIHYFYFKFFLTSSVVNKCFKKLLYYKKTKLAKNTTGVRILRSRGAKLNKSRFFSVNFNLRLLRLGMIVAFRLTPFNKKLLSLVYFSNGAFAFFLASTKFSLFQFWGRNLNKRLQKLKLFRNFLIFNALYKIKKLSFVFCVELIPGKNSQYMLSTGSKAKILKLDLNSHTILLQLPSKLKKFFSYYSFSLYDQAALPEKKKMLNTKAGYWRSFGVKSIVRGVAMNAVDHPHGGRTKSVKTPLTPWGFVTKKK